MTPDPDTETLDQLADRGGLPTKEYGYILNFVCDCGKKVREHTPNEFLKCGRAHRVFRPTQQAGQC